MSASSVVIIGLDGLDRNLVDAWIDQGDLPVLESLLRTGVSGRVANPVGFEAGSSWPCFYYGTGPATHGQFDGMLRFDGERYEKRLLGFDELTGIPFWRSASDARKRVALIDLPYALLEPEINGVQVTDWLCHVFRTCHVTTQPPDLAPSIAQAYGDSPFTRSNPCPTNLVDLSTPRNVELFRADLIQRIANKTAYSKNLLQQEDWNLFFTVFHDAHDVGHMCWHIHDQAHERHDPALAEAVGDPIRDVYIALDQAVGELRDTIGRDAVLILYSNTGIGPECTASAFLDNILKRLWRIYRSECGGQVPDNGHSPKPPRRSGGIDQLLSGLYAAAVPEKLRHRMRQTKLMQWHYDRHYVAERRQRPFMELSANHATGGVRINLAGRDPHGVVEPGPAYEALCARLMEDLCAIVNLDTGEPLVASAILTSEHYAGPARAALPDILLGWSQSGPIKRIRSDKLGTLENPHVRARTGDHVNKDGFFIASGPGLGTRRMNRTVDVTDFAPTLAALLGIDGPGYEGKTIPELTPG